MTDKKPTPHTLDLFAPLVAPAPPGRPTAPAPPGIAPPLAAPRSPTPPAPLLPAPPVAAPRATVAPAPGNPAPPVAAADAGPRSYQVSELVRMASRTLEARFADVWVEGEVSNLRAPGHVYFTLKDAEGQLAAVMFRSQAQRLKFRLTDGLKVRARGRLAIYDAQGKLQLYTEAIEPAGLGALQLAFEQLKKKLAAEGLFDEARKRPLPFLPRCIGVATSPTGAAVRDIIRVAQRRGPCRLLIAPCLVQGDAAPADIVRALAALGRRPEVELIIVGRGGGSAEDLAAFNDEAVARAIAGSRVPVISAVGHEVDYTIADFVADRRAATPSQAAELAVPVHAELLQSLGELSARLTRSGRRNVGDARAGLDDLHGELLDLLQRSMAERHKRLAALSARLGALHPRARLLRDRALLDGLAHRLARPLADKVLRGRRLVEPAERRMFAAMQQTLSRRRRALETACGKLDALSPLRVLERGYGLVRRPSGEVVTRAAQVSPGDAILVRLSRGAVSATVDRVLETAGAGDKRADDAGASDGGREE